jgi:hypothetical protein
VRKKISSAIGVAFAVTALTAAAAPARERPTETVRFGYAYAGIPGSLKVTVLAIVDPVPRPADDSFISRGPARGSRFVTLRLRLANVGRSEYDADLYGGDTTGPFLYGSDGAVHSAASLLGWGCDREPLNDRLLPGEVALGCKTFELRRGVRPTLLAVNGVLWNLAAFDPQSHGRKATLRESSMMQVPAAEATILRYPPGCALLSYAVDSRATSWGTITALPLTPRCRSVRMTVLAMHRAGGRWRVLKDGANAGCHLPASVREDLRAACSR